MSKLRRLHLRLRGFPSPTGPTHMELTGGVLTPDPDTIEEAVLTIRDENEAPHYFYLESKHAIALRDWLDEYIQMMDAQSRATRGR